MSRLEEIDKNFKIETSLEKSDIKFYSALKKPFSIYGVRYENGKFRRMPEEVAKSVNSGVEYLHTNTLIGVVSAEVTNGKFAFLSLKMVGFETEKSKKAEFAIGAYVVTTQDGQKSCLYLQEGTPVDGEKYAYIKYNDFVSTNI